MPSDYVLQAVSQRGLEAPRSKEQLFDWATALVSRLNLEYIKTLAQARLVLNNVIAEFNEGDVQLGLNGPKLMWGTGVPVADPEARALYIDVAGGAGTTLYVWEGAAWAAK